MLADRNWTERVLRRVSSQFTILVIGQVSSGKSSLINALLGRRLLRPSGDPTDGVISLLLAADERGERAERVAHDGSVTKFQSVEAALRFLRQQDTAAKDQLACREVRLYLDEPLLQTFRIINTPGLGDRLAAFEDTTLQYLAEDESDLVVWTFFPDNTANEQEVELFGRALSRRRHAVLGVITHCLEGHEDDPLFDPQKDSALAQVEAHVRKHLGDYLVNVVRFDSHAARQLNDDLRRDPAAASGSEFVRASVRCGRTALESALTTLLPEGSASVERARVESVLRRCSATAYDLAKVAREVETRALRRSRTADVELQAWKRLETAVLAPARVRLRQSLRVLASERAGEMVDVMGQAAHDAILEHFALGETLFRAIGSYTPWCDSMGDKLSRLVGANVQDALARVQFFPRLVDATDSVVVEQFEALGRSLEGGVSETDAPAVDRVHVPADSVLGQALSGPMKALAGTLLKQAMSGIEKKLVARAAQQTAEQAGRVAAGRAAKGAAQQAGRAAASKATQQAAQRAAQQGALSTLGSVLSIATLVLLPLDLRKLYSDFQKGREHAAKQVKQQYLASRGTYEVRLFDTVWPPVEDRLTAALADARREANSHGEEAQRWSTLGEQAASAAGTLEDFAEGFREAL